MRPRAYIAALALTVSGAAVAEGVTGYVEENYSHTNSTVTGETGRTTRSEVDEILQRYHLNLDHGFWPLLRLNAGGIFEQVNDWASGVGVETGWSRTTSAFGTLAAGSPMLNAAAGYNFRTDRQSTSATSLVLENPSFIAGWRPLELPWWSFRIDRQHIYDTAHAVQDVTTLNAILAGTYTPIRELTLQYSASYSNPVDAILDTDAKSLTQVLRGDYAQTFGTRASVGAGINVTDRRQQISVSGAGGEIVTTQTPIAGLSGVERFPASAAQITLSVTPALVDGNLTAATSIDLGTSVQASGDRDARDIGVQFVDALTQVNTFYLTVNQTLPPEITRQFQWTAWQSDDNLRWTQVPVTAAVAFEALLNRFEITISTTQARYLKVVTTPLDPAATIDRRFANILVTELQALLVTKVTQSTGWQRSLATTLTANARTQLWVPELAYDFSGMFLHTEQPAFQQNTYLLTNGLTYTRKMNTFLLFTARGARLDQDEGRGHEGGFIYSASLGANELPTLSHNLVYSGQSLWTNLGFTSTNSLSLYNRAVPYRGIGVLLGGSYSLVVGGSGQLLRSLSVTSSVTVQPHAGLTLAGLFGHTASETTGGDQPRSMQVTNRFDGTVTFNPVPAISLNATVSRIVTPPAARTLASGTANFSPFPGGDLQFSLTYTETYQQYSSTDRLLVPAVRWNIRPTTFLTVSWTWLSSAGQVAENDNRIFGVNFQTTL